MRPSTSHVRWFGSVVCLLAACLARPAFADRRPPQVLVGVTFAQMRFENTRDLGIDWRNSITAGVSFPVPVLPEDGPIGLRGQVLLVPRGGAISDGIQTEKFKFSYIDLMALVDLELKPTIRGEHIHLLIGPTLHVRTSAKVYVNGQAFDIGDNVQRVDAGIAIGADFTLIPRRLDVQVTYIPGLRPIFKTSANNAKNSTLLVLITPRLVR